jgi:hypothetical protein
MHYSVLAITKEKPTEESLAELMEPFGDGQKWDWYQVGGRWTGVLGGYDPEKDPANIEECDLCAGTGTRPGGLEQFGAKWMENCHGCNGCNGTGKKVKWPTQWQEHDGDSALVESLTEEHHGKFHAFLVEYYGWFECEEYVPWAEGSEKFVKKELPPLKWLKEQGKWATVIDCHN